MVGVAMDITERKIAEKQVEDLNRQLVETSRQAGMSEIATGVLHNVGNVLNSVNVTASLLRDSLNKSQIHNLVKATNLLRDHAADSAAFLTTDPRGQRLPGFLIKLGDHIASEQLAWEKELVGLGTNIEHIKEIVAMQQSYARLTGVTEALSAEELVKDALQINESALNRHGVELVEDFQPAPLVVVDKHKVLQILINLFRNAKHALDNSGRRDKVLTLSIRAGDGGRVFIQVRDNGIGIAPENISRIFQHGFTTKKEGHGFGLHSGANAAKEMGGKLSAQSDGVGHGAVFTLELPVAPATPLDQANSTIAATTPDLTKT
jgi:signal transduction histidine kinase